MDYFEQQVQKEAHKSANLEAALRLVNLMSQISEKCMSAGWLDGLEFSLWRVIENPSDNKFGQGFVTESQINQLITLSNESKGWWEYLDENDHETFISIDDWKKKYNDYKKCLEAL